MFNQCHLTASVQYTLNYNLTVDPKSSTSGDTLEFYLVYNYISCDSLDQCPVATLCGIESHHLQSTLRFTPASTGTYYLVAENTYTFDDLYLDANVVYQYHGTPSASPTPTRTPSTSLSLVAVPPPPADDGDNGSHVWVYVVTLVGVVVVLLALVSAVVVFVIHKKKQEEARKISAAFSAPEN